MQNVSPDPLAPCVMYWPDNEPFPEKGQIRPPWPGGLGSGVGQGSGVQAAGGSGGGGGMGGMSDAGSTGSMGKGAMPPILNTGNKGPIEQQPGDWVCGKCGYLVSEFIFVLFQSSMLRFPFSTPHPDCVSWGDDDVIR